MQDCDVNDAAFKLMFYQILCALKFIHSCNLVHRDIKPSNILIDQDTMQATISDFGMARSLPKSALGKHNGNSTKVRESVLKDESCFDMSSDSKA